MTKINENEIGRQDINAIFKNASTLPQGRLSKIFNRNPREKVEVSDLQQAWQQAGYPDDIRDIEHILTDFGFAKKEINKVFQNTFGKSGDEYDTPTASQAILKIANYAKKAGIDQDLIAFMQKEYGFKVEEKFKGKAVVEDVRYIFDAIVKEERVRLPEMMRTSEFEKLGRNKK